MNQRYIKQNSVQTIYNYNDIMIGHIQTRSAPMVQCLEHSPANLLVVGSNPTRTSICGICSITELPLSHMS